MRIYRNIGDALKADKIAVEARSISSIRYGPRTGNHRGQFATLRDNAFCVIETPLKSVLTKKK